MLIDTEFTEKQYNPLPIDYDNYKNLFNRINQKGEQEDNNRGYPQPRTPKDVLQRSRDLVIGSNFAETVQNYDEDLSFKMRKSDSRRDSIRYETKNRSKSCLVQKIKSSRLRFDLYLIRDFKLNLRNLLPILQVLGKGSSIVQQILKFFVLNNLHQEFSNCFPIKVTVPIGYSFSAKVEFFDFQFFENNNSESNGHDRSSDDDLDDQLFFLPM